MKRKSVYRNIQESRSISLARRSSVGLAPATGLNISLLMLTASRLRPRAAWLLPFATSAAELAASVSTYNSMEVFTYSYADQGEAQVSSAAPTRSLIPRTLNSWKLHVAVE